MLVLMTAGGLTAFPAGDDSVPAQCPVAGPGLDFPLAQEEPAAPQAVDGHMQVRLKAIVAPSFPMLHIRPLFYVFSMISTNYNFSFLFLNVHLVSCTLRSIPITLAANHQHRPTGAHSPQQPTAGRVDQVWTKAE